MSTLHGIAVITGAQGGIAQSPVRAFATAGYAVLGVDVREPLATAVEGAHYLTVDGNVTVPVRQSCVFRDADAVLAAGPAAMTQLEIGELASSGVGRERGDPVPVGVGDLQLRAGVRAFLAHDYPHPRRPGLEIQQAGDVGDPRTLAELAVTVVGWRPTVARYPRQRLSGRLNSTEYDN